MTRVAIGADHAGYELKQHLVTMLLGQGYEVDAGLAGPTASASGFAPGQDRDVDQTGPDVERRPVDERLRAVAAHRRVLEAGRPDAQAVGDESRRVAVAPRQLAHHPERVGSGWTVEPGVGRGGEHGAFHQRGGLEAVVERLGAVDVLADADDDRRARVGWARGLSGTHGSAP